MQTAASAARRMGDDREFEATVQALRARCGFHTLRRALKAADVSAGVGWADLIANGKAGDATAEKLKDFIAQFYREHIAYGERFVQLHDVDDECVANICSQLSRPVAPISEFSKRYPLPLAIADLITASPSPVLAEIRSLEGGDVALIFCSARAYEERQTYPYDTLGQEVKKAFAGVHEVITVQRSFYQAFDSVIFRPGLRRLEVCVDMPVRHTKTIEPEATAIALLAACTLYLPALVPVYQSATPKNLFPAIAGIYRSPSEGEVRSLAFRTLTGSLKKERMTSSDVDLRTEDFHSAGVIAVHGEINPFQITVGWEFTLPRGQAEVSLSAMLREINAETPSLNACTVSECVANSSLVQAINKIVKYL